MSPSLGGEVVPGRRELEKRLCCNIAAIKDMSRFYLVHCVAHVPLLLVDGAGGALLLRRRGGCSLVEPVPVQDVALVEPGEEDVRPDKLVRVHGGHHLGHQEAVKVGAGEQHLLEVKVLRRSLKRAKGS